MISAISDSAIYISFISYIKSNLKSIGFLILIQ